MGKHQSFVFSLKAASGQELAVPAHRVDTGPQVYSPSGAALSTTSGQLINKSPVFELLNQSEPLSGIKCAHSVVSIRIRVLM